MNAFASVAGDVNKANDLYSQGKIDDSLGLYQKALEQDNKSAAIQYNLGTAFYKKGDYAKAMRYLEDAVKEKNLKIKPRAEYNLGNVLFRTGLQKEKANVDEAIKTLQKSLGAYTQTLADDPKDEDAKFNEEVVKKEIKRLKQKKQQQKQQKQQQQSQQNQQNQNQQQQQQNQQNQNQQQQQQQNRQNQQQQNQQNQDQQQNQQQQQNQDQQNQQQNQQDQQNQNQQDQQNQQKGPEKQNPQDQQRQPSEAESQQDLDRKQAEELLEDYKDNEEPKKLLNYMPKKIDERPVLKDW